MPNSIHPVADDGHTTVYGVGTDTAGNSVDPNIGDRGNVLWVRDPGYGDSSNAAPPEAHRKSVSCCKLGTMPAW